MVYAVAAAVGWGVVCGLLHAPFWAVAMGGVAASGWAIQLEWGAISGGAAQQRSNFWLLLVAAYLFLGMMAIGLVSLGYFAGEWLLFQLHRFL